MRWHRLEKKTVAESRRPRAFEGSEELLDLRQEDEKIAGAADRSART
jgi:hypothetical protein